MKLKADITLIISYEIISKKNNWEDNADEAFKELQTAKELILREIKKIKSIVKIQEDRLRIRD